MGFFELYETGFPPSLNSYFSCLARTDSECLSSECLQPIAACFTCFEIEREGKKLDFKFGAFCFVRQLIGRHRSHKWHFIVDVIGQRQEKNFRPPSNFGIRGRPRGHFPLSHVPPPSLTLLVTLLRLLPVFVLLLFFLVRLSSVRSVMSVVD